MKLFFSIRSIRLSMVLGIFKPLHACAYYIGFFAEESVPEALWGHPSVGNLDRIILVLSKVASDVHVFSEPKVSNLYVSITIQPGTNNVKYTIIKATAIKQSDR